MEIAKHMYGSPLQNTRRRLTMEILVVEDDPVIGKSVMKGLTEAGHRCIWTKNGNQGLEYARSQQYDVILLDLLIPEMSGMEILEKVRGEGIRTPIIVLTAKGAVDDRVNGLRKGADDYVVKPFFMAELLESSLKPCGDARDQAGSAASGR